MFTTSSGRLQPVWAFVMSAILSAAAFYFCAWIGLAIAGDRIVFSELIFRSLLPVTLLGLFSWLLTTANHVEEHRLAAMGLPWVRGALRQFGVGALAGVVLVALAVVPVFVWAHPQFSLHGGSRTAARSIAILLILVTGSLAEELMFRGYPFQRLEEGIGAAGAIAVFSLLFGAVHLVNPGASVWGLINTVLIGVLLSIAYLRSRALWLPWGIHLGWNAALGLFTGLPVSGLRIFNAFLRTNVSGPRWLTGGSYGLEASVAGTGTIVIGLIAVVFWPVERLADTLLSQTGEETRPQRLSGIQS